MAKNIKRKKRKVMSEAARRKRRIAIARIRAFLLVLVIAGGALGLVKLNKSIEVPLSVNAENYYQIEETSIDDSDWAEDADEVLADTRLELSKYMVARPKLREEYPIDMNILSKYAIVYDIQADEVLYAKDPEEKCYPASTTKILTASVVIDNAPEDFVFTAGDELDFVNPESSLAFVEKGNMLDLETTIDALMLPSGNDASYMAAANIGRYILGDEEASPEDSVQAFMDEMNRVAVLIGTENTHFTAPDGFHDDDHYTTVLDMLKITLYARTKPMIMASVQKPERETAFLSGETVSWYNSNKLIQEDSDYYYLYANGFKTGMTDESGYCVVATARRFDHDIICIVFGAEDSSTRWNDTIALLDAAFVQVRNNREDN